MGCSWQPYKSLNVIVKNDMAGTVQYVGVVHASIFAAVGTLAGYLSSFCQHRALQDYFTELKEFTSLVQNYWIHRSCIPAEMWYECCTETAWAIEINTHTREAEVAWNAIATWKEKEFPGCLLKLDGCSGAEQSWELCKVLIMIFISHQSKWNREET